MLADFGDDLHRYASAKARKDHLATRLSARPGEKIVMAWYVYNNRLRDALDGQAFAPSAPRPEPGLATSLSAPA